MFVCHDYMIYLQCIFNRTYKRVGSSYVGRSEIEISVTCLILKYFHNTFGFDKNGVSRCR